MIKDIIVHLEHQAARDPARDLPSRPPRSSMRISPQLLLRMHRIFRAM
jgi:hypothetical protein